MVIQKSILTSEEKINNIWLFKENNFAHTSAKYTQPFLTIKNIRKLIFQIKTS